MSSQLLPIRTESAVTPGGLSLEMRFAIVALAIVLAGAADFMLHAVWLPSLTSQLAVQQLRPDDAVAQVLRGIPEWANWSHAILAILVGGFAFVVLHPFFRQCQHARQCAECRDEEE